MQLFGHNQISVHWGTLLENITLQKENFLLIYKCWIDFGCPGHSSVFQYIFNLFHCLLYFSKYKDSLINSVRITIFLCFNHLRSYQCLKYETDIVQKWTDKSNSWDKTAAVKLTLNKTLKKSSKGVEIILSNTIFYIVLSR